MTEIGKALINIFEIMIVVGFIGGVIYLFIYSLITYFSHIRNAKDELTYGRGDFKTFLFLFSKYNLTECEAQIQLNEFDTEDLFDSSFSFSRIRFNKKGFIAKNYIEYLKIIRHMCYIIDLNRRTRDSLRSEDKWV